MSFTTGIKAIYPTHAGQGEEKNKRELGHVLFTGLYYIPHYEPIVSDANVRRQTPPTQIISIPYPHFLPHKRVI